MRYNFYTIQFPVRVIDEDDFVWEELIELRVQARSSKNAVENVQYALNELANSNNLSALTHHDQDEVTLVSTNK